MNGVKAILVTIVLPLFLGSADRDPKTWEQALEISKKIAIVDCHSHDLFKPKSSRFPKQVDFAMLKNATINGIVQAFPISPRKQENPSEYILTELKNFHDSIICRKSQMLLQTDSDDFFNSENDDKLKLFFAIEYFYGIFDGQAEMLSKYYEEGVRSIGIFNGGKDTIYTKSSDGYELTGFATGLVKEMNSKGVICDLTHLPDSVRRLIVHSSSSPVCISHANARLVVNSKFNVADETLHDLAQKGGLICLTFCSDYVSNKYREDVDKKGSRKNVEHATIESFIDHIDYLKKTIGIDYIGIGSDYGGSGRLAPQGLETIEGFPLIVYHMLKRGYSENEIEKVMGLNFIRFFKRVESAAK